MPPPCRRRLRQLGRQLRPAPLASASSAVEVEAPLLLYSPPDPARLGYTEPTTEAVCAALRADGCALLEAVIAPEVALRLGELLRGYVPLPHEDGRDTGTDVGPNRRSRALCRPRDLSELPAHPAVGHRIQPAGFTPDCDWSGNITTLFQRDPAFLALVGPSPVREVMDAMLGDQCHLITMKGWRHGPGHGGNNNHPASPGVHGGGFHCDEMWLPDGLPEEVAAQLGPYLENSVHIIGARKQPQPTGARHSFTAPLSCAQASANQIRNARARVCCRHLDLSQRHHAGMLPDACHPRLLPLLPPPETGRDQLGGPRPARRDRQTRRHAAVPLGRVARGRHERDGEYDAADGGGGVRREKGLAEVLALSGYEAERADAGARNSAAAPAAGRAPALKLRLRSSG
jgi:hypothetical protein